MQNRSFMASKKQLEKLTRGELLEKARALGLSGRNRMSKQELVEVLSRAPGRRAATREAQVKSRGVQKATGAAQGARSDKSRPTRGRNVKNPGPEEREPERPSRPAKKRVAEEPRAVKKKGDKKLKPAAKKAELTGKTLRPRKRPAETVAPAERKAPTKKKPPRPNRQEPSGRGGGDCRRRDRRRVEEGDKAGQKAKARTPRKKSRNRKPRPDRTTEPREPRVAVREVPVPPTLVLLVIDPFWVHAYWQIPRLALEAARRRIGEPTARLVLRVRDVTDRDDAPGDSFDVTDISSPSGNYYLNFGKPRRTLFAEIGVRARDGRFSVICRSNRVDLPAPGESALFEDRRARVRGRGDPLWKSRAAPRATEFPTPVVAEAALDVGRWDAPAEGQAVAPSSVEEGAPGAEETEEETVSAPQQRTVAGPESPGEALPHAGSPPILASRPWDSVPEPVGAMPFGAVEPVVAAAARVMAESAVVAEQLATESGAFEAPGLSGAPAFPSCLEPDATVGEGAPSDGPAVSVSSPLSSLALASWVAGSQWAFSPARRPDRPGFEVQADLVVYGRAQPGTEIQVDGVRITVNSDGTFERRFSLPSKLEKELPESEH